MSSKSSFIDSSIDKTEVSSVKAGHSGASNGADIPVKFFISPFRALAYRPLTSRCSQMARGSHFSDTITWTDKCSYCYNSAIYE